jgi:hypothetical protein
MFNASVVTAPSKQGRTVLNMTITTASPTLPDDTELFVASQHWLQGLVPIPDPIYGLTVGDGKALIVVRESNEFDLMAFATMIRQVLEQLAGRIAGVEKVLAATGPNAEVMRHTTEGETLRREWGAYPLYQGTQVYGWVFEVEGTTFLFAMTSATSDASEDLTNSFTTDLIDVAKRVRPRHLYTGPATRLVRRKDLGETLGREVGLLDILIHTKEVPDGINPMRDPGSTQWTLLCMQAENDLRYTVTRLLTGRIFHVRRNEWLSGPGSLPLGFQVKSAENKVPVVGDADEVACARLLIDLAATAYEQLGRELTNDEELINVDAIVRRLSAAGAKKRSNKKADKYGDPIRGMPLGTVGNPRAAVISLLEVLPAYSMEGVISRVYGLPMAGLTSHDVHGMTIYRQKECDTVDAHKTKGVVVFDWTFPKPTDDAGDVEPWASEEQLQKASKFLEHLKAASDRPPPTRKMWPFAGLFKAEHEGLYYRLVHGSGGYQWRASHSRGFNATDNWAVGKFAPRLLAERFVEALLNRLEDEGIDPRTAVISKRRELSKPDADRVTALRRSIAALDKEFTQSQDAARRASTDRSKNNHQAHADKIAYQLESLEAELVAADDAATITQTSALAPDTIEVSTLATLMSVLLDTSGVGTEPEVCDALQRIVTNGTITDCWDDASPWATFSCTVLVRTDSGVRSVPIEFEIGNTSQGPERKAFAGRLERVLNLRMTTSISIDELSTRLGYQPAPATVARNLHDVLAAKLRAAGRPELSASRAASALIDCPIDSTRDLVWRMLTHQPLPEIVEDLSPSETKRHAEGLRDAYLSTRFDWDVPAWSSGGERQRREIVRWVAANTNTDDSDHGASLQALLRAIGSKSSFGFTNKHIHNNESPAEDGVARLLERTAPWPSGSFTNPSIGARLDSVAAADKRVRLRSCPHCGHGEGLMPAPWVEVGVDPVLCPSCLHNPGDPSWRYPASYGLPHEGPFGRSKTDERSPKIAGQRVGTTIGGPTAMPSATRVKRANTR